MSTPTPQTPEEIRVENRARFDATNKAAGKVSQDRRDAGDAARAEDKRQRMDPVSEAAAPKPDGVAHDTGDMGENDSIGG